MTKIITKTLKNESVYVRLDPLEKKAIVEAAKHDGMKLSAWVRLIVLSAARRRGKDDERN